MKSISFEKANEDGEAAAGGRASFFFVVVSFRCGVYDMWGFAFRGLGFSEGWGMRV